METVTITLPMPPKGSSPNHRVCWQAKVRTKKKMREDGHAAALKAKGRRRGFPWAEASVQVTYYRKDRRGVRDHDNAIATLKHYLDGLVDAGLVVDDRGLTFLPVRQEIDAADPRVEIVLSKIGKYQEAVR